jgi:mono/diheme cytochrome c family protein
MRRKLFTAAAGVALAGIVAGNLAGCGPREPRAGMVLALKGDVMRGRAVYDAHCAACHVNRAAWGTVVWLYGGYGVVGTVIRGVPKTKMPSFAALSDPDLSDLWAYVSSLKAGKAS